MNHKRPPVQAIVVVVLLVAVSVYFIVTQVLSNKKGALTASGFIEATQVNVAPEMAGKANKVLAEEGQAVSTGDLLLQLDSSLLDAQRAVAAAAVDSAKAALTLAQTNYDLAAQTALAQQQASRSKDWRYSAPDDFNQPAWYFDSDEQLKSAQSEVDAAQAALEAAQSDLAKVLADVNNADLIAAERRLSDARASYLVADSVKVSADYAAEGGSLQKAADKAYNDALAELRAAQDVYNELLDTKAAENVKNARAAVVVARQRYDAAYARYVSLQTGLNSPAVVMAKSALEQAKTALAQAEANLALLDAQIAKLTLSSPMNGVVLTRNVEAGEFVQPGATAFVLGELNNLTITVYVPENRYGEVSLGQQAELTVDSFPDLTFTAEVIQIADKAEFTPRNVQTVEGRSSTVYAIKLKVNDPDGKLKIGMPADVAFK
ncbi:MAG: efflux RND transporter periplasmic adaptor subunit [Chloroflexi bacterium]|nr:efflux RND transporter periplasmic adaptor subunit [Chloroflexota bacterium]